MAYSLRGIVQLRLQPETIVLDAFCAQTIMTHDESTGTISCWIQGLATKEDSGFIHKILGLMALVSYAWRLVRVGDEDMGFASHSEYTLSTLLLHLTLGTSSFQFRIPRKRIATDGGRIWPEYRLHSFVFAARSMACVAVNWYEQQFYIQPDYSKNLWIVLACMGAADLSSYYVGRFHSNTVRCLSAPALAKYYFSVMQFFATAAHLVGGRRSSIYFYILMVIQVSAFLLTLRRRHLVSHSFNLLAYGLFLCGGLSAGIYECHKSGYNLWANGAVIALTACTAALWRMGPWPRVYRHKYVIWTTVYLGLNGVLRPVLARHDNALLTQSQMITLAWFDLMVPTRPKSLAFAQSVPCPKNCKVSGVTMVA